MSAELQAYRQSEGEVTRTSDLLTLLPDGRNSILDIGARDGHFSRLFTTRFPSVVALDLTRPEWSYPGVDSVQGDVTCLDFPDNSFDCVFCAEVLEHIPDLQRACAELQRVTRHELIVGVPFRQDLRLGRTTCTTCGAVNPPWGHVNRFTLDSLQGLFPALSLKRVSYVGQTRSVTNRLSALLMDWAGNPWGVYDQKEPCLRCGASLTRPAERRSPFSRGCSFLAHNITGLQQRFTSPRPNWIHAVFQKDSADHANS